MRKSGIAILAAALTALLTASCAGRFHTTAAMEYFSFSHTASSTGSIYTFAAEKTAGGWIADFDLLCGQRVFSLSMSQEDAQRLEVLTDTCGLWSWSGFHRTDGRVSDGEGFRLLIRYADGKELSASGGNKFPEGYRRAESEIMAFFTGIMEKNGVENPF